MVDELKSGKDVVDEFFAEVLHIKGVDKKTVQALLVLHNEGKLTDTNIQNAMEQLLREELEQKTNDKD